MKFANFKDTLFYRIPPVTASVGNIDLHNLDTSQCSAGKNVRERCIKNRKRESVFLDVTAVNVVVQKQPSRGDLK